MKEIKYTILYGTVSVRIIITVPVPLRSVINYSSSSAVAKSYGSFGSGSATLIQLVISLRVCDHLRKGSVSQLTWCKKQSVMPPNQLINIPPKTSQTTKCDTYMIHAG